MLNSTWACYSTPSPNSMSQLICFSLLLEFLNVSNRHLPVKLRVKKLSQKWKNRYKQIFFRYRCCVSVEALIQNPSFIRHDSISASLVVVVVVVVKYICTGFVICRSS